MILYCQGKFRTFGPHTSSRREEAAKHLKPSPLALWVAPDVARLVPSANLVPDLGKDDPSIRNSLSTLHHIFFDDVALQNRARGALTVK